MLLQRSGLPRSRRFVPLAAVGLLLCVCAGLAHAQLDREAWLQYPMLSAEAAQSYKSLPGTVLVLGDSPLLKSAQQELKLGTNKLLHRELRNAPSAGIERAIIIGTLSQLQAFASELKLAKPLAADGFWLKSVRLHRKECLIITAENERGVLYGVFALLSKIAREEKLDSIDQEQEPYAAIRWVNQWDNLDGRIERGYGGPSIFFSDGKVRDDLTRAGEYARLLASIGINGCTVNNVNANPHALEDAFFPQLKRIADVFRPWGVQLSIAVDLSSPKVIGGLDTFDPLDARVADWWKKKFDQIYAQIPDFGGVVIKADSEGRSGPSAYGRTHADAANVIARALKPHGGVVFYRAFVYSHHLDWHDLKNDRARAAYDNFHPLDGTFDDNAIVQIKNGPIDFQVREPVSPLLGGLRKTNEVIELQITQEYTGQQRHLCFLVPLWKEVLDFDLHAEGTGDASTPVKDLVAGKVFQRPAGGFVGVANVGLDDNWLGSPLAMANLYGFGRLAWNANLSSQQIVDEWTRLTFGDDPLAVRVVNALQLDSWHVYESYTGPLGAGTLTNIVGNHYDPGPQSSEENGWGQWHRADHNGIGMDRTVATGTGYIGQYSPAVQKMYEPLAGCPDDLLLFFHHVPYTYKLRSGKTVIQHVYDSHYEGAEQAHEFVARWKTVEGHVDAERYLDILKRFEYQTEQAVVWRDVICKWIYQLSGIPDDKGRVGAAK